MKLQLGCQGGMWCACTSCSEHMQKAATKLAEHQAGAKFGPLGVIRQLA